MLTTQEKGLTLEDTQGMFLLLAAGFLIAAAALISEWMGGCTRKCRVPKIRSSTASSQNNLIGTPKSDAGSEIKVISDDDSKIYFNNRLASGKSDDTLEGEVINVTEENIIVHENLDVNDWVSIRSSSPDVDREVREIFEKDLRRRRGTSISVSKPIDEIETVSNKAFGNVNTY